MEHEQHGETGHEQHHSATAQRYTNGNTFVAATSTPCAAPTPCCTQRQAHPRFHMPRTWLQSPWSSLETLPRTPRGCPCPVGARRWRDHLETPCDHAPPTPGHEHGHAAAQHHWFTIRLIIQQLWQACARVQAVNLTQSLGTLTRAYTRAVPHRGTKRTCSAGQCHGKRTTPSRSPQKDKCTHQSKSTPSKPWSLQNATRLSTSAVRVLTSAMTLENVVVLSAPPMEISVFSDGFTDFRPTLTR